MFKLIFFLCVVTFAVLAEQAVFLEHTESLPLPAGWRRTTSFAISQSSSRTLNVIVALKQRNLDQLNTVFWEVSDPQNAKYGQHLSLEEITALVAPSEENIMAVVNWLENNGATDVEVVLSKDFVRAKMTTLQASKMFSVRYHNYVHTSGKTVDASTGPYTVPVELSNMIDFVSGIVGFPDVAPVKIQKSSDSDLGLAITPEVIRARYNVSNTVGTNSKNSHAVAEFQAQYYSPADLKTFWNRYVTFAPEQTVAKIVGTNHADQPGIEASLDIEYLMGVAPGVTTWFYSMANFNFWNDLTNWVSELNNENNVPWVHSVSYGSQGDYPSDAYRDRLNAEFQKVGTRGVSILFASGDDGAGCGGELRSSDFCDCTFFPSFPATCPYITSVGATKFLSGNSGPEGAVSLFKSGGGFSQDFPTQSYQSSDVSAYLNSGVRMPESCSFNASGRATPDVGALGDEHFQVVNGGSTISVGGTSASCPSFSAIVTLLNDHRLNNGKSTLGFLNPFLYQTAASTPNAFFDVTVGNNVNSGCCNSGKLSGFDCATGWDPVTGLGTPNFAVLDTLM